MQRAVALGELRRKGIERARELQNGERRLIELRIATRAPDRRHIEMAIGADGDLDHRVGMGTGLPSGCREIQGADALDLGAPGDEVGRNDRGARIRRHPELIALGSPQPYRSLVVGSGLVGRLLLEQQGLLRCSPGAALVGEILDDAAPGGSDQHAPVARAGRLAASRQGVAVRRPLLRRQDRSLGRITGRDLLARVAGADLRPLREICRVVVAIRRGYLVRDQQYLQAWRAAGAGNRRLEREPEDDHAVQQSHEEEHREQTVPDRGSPFPQHQSASCHAGYSTPSRRAMAPISWPAMSMWNCFSSSRMPVGLVTLISVTKPPMTSSPTKSMPLAASAGPIWPASQRSRSSSGRPTPRAPAARLPRLSWGCGIRANAYGTGSPSMRSTRESPVATISGR